MPTVRTLDEVAAIASAARCKRTPCGDGEMVWHVWGQGPSVVLLHGGSGSWTHWVRNLEALLRSGHRVLAPDMPGFGDSAAPPDGQDADVLPHWIEKGVEVLLGRQTFDLGGASVGCAPGVLEREHQLSTVARGQRSAQPLIEPKTSGAAAPSP